MAQKFTLPVLKSIMGLQVLNPNRWSNVVNEDGIIIDKVQSVGYWIAEIHHASSFFGLDNVVVSVVTTNKWKKGVVLTPTLTKKMETSSDKRPIHAIDVTDWFDPVAEALKTVNVFPNVDTIPMGDFTHRYSIRFATALTQGNFHIGPGPIHTEFDSLWIALLSTTMYLADLYNNDEIREHINYEEFKSKVEQGKNNTNQ